MNTASDSQDDILAIDDEVTKYLTEHAAEIAAEEKKEFALSDLTEDEKKELKAQNSRRGQRGTRPHVPSAEDRRS